MLDKVKALWRDEEGATMVEYALMLALIAVVCILVITALGGKVADTFQNVDTAMPATP